MSSNSQNYYLNSYFGSAQIFFVSYYNFPRGRGQSGSKKPRVLGPTTLISELKTKKVKVSVSSKLHIIKVIKCN